MISHPIPQALASALLVVILTAPDVTHATVITYATPTGATLNSLPVNAKATFTTDTDMVTIVLDNLQADPKSIVQNISNLFFTIDSGQDAGSIISSVGIERTIDGLGGYVDGSSAVTGWTLREPGGQLHLDLIGASPTVPAHTIIGPPNAGTDNYDNANGSITVAAPHNPFFAESVTFVLEVPGVTASSSISAATFSFGTQSGFDVTAVPEPSSALLAILSILGLAMKRRHRAGS